MTAATLPAGRAQPVPQATEQTGADSASHTSGFPASPPRPPLSPVDTQAHASAKACVEVREPPGDAPPVVFPSEKGDTRARSAGVAHGPQPARGGASGTSSSALEQRLDARKRLSKGRNKTKQQNSKTEQEEAAPGPGLNPEPRTHNTPCCRPWPPASRPGRPSHAVPRLHGNKSHRQSAPSPPGPAPSHTGGSGGHVGVRVVSWLPRPRCL